MVDHNEIVKEQLSEQIAIEEHLCGVLREQISEIDTSDFADARDLLTKTAEVLERHFVTLNKLLDKLEQETLNVNLKGASYKGTSNGLPIQKEDQSRSISRILRDDYSALNLITISNTILHTTGLALDSQEVAAVALKHLENLAPLVVQIGELLPVVATRELHAHSPAIDLTIAKTALKNARVAWRK